MIFALDLRPKIIPPAPFSLSNPDDPAFNNSFLKEIGPTGARAPLMRKPFAAIAEGLVLKIGAGSGNVFSMQHIKYWHVKKIIEGFLGNSPKTGDSGSEGSPGA
ncbi:MAG: hypothetical protein LBU64_02300 [Planctomycetota bacterium]|nr:hypothetical protein [Planctomycetota bacterium]